ncbi:MAG TPA: NAD-dependent epimerase/dehydratase family protein [Pantanalinema sp.]
MTPSNLHVIIGAGPLGLSLAEQLLAQDRRVRLVSRRGRPLSGSLSAAEVRAADVTSFDQVRAACEGAGVIYHCAVPRYTDWVEQCVPLMAGILEGAAASGAKLVYGDNLYAYGPVTGPIHEGLPAAATDRKGMARARVADMLLSSHRAGRVRGTIGRASDFYGPGVSTSTMGDRVFRALLAGRPADLVGNPDQPHTYTYIEDFARALIVLGDRDDALGGIWHVPNAPTLTARHFIAKVGAQLGSAPEIRVAPGWLIRAMGAFAPMVREVAEMLYSSERPYIVDHGKFERAFCDIATSHDEAIRKTLDWCRAQPEMQP